MSYFQGLVMDVSVKGTGVVRHPDGRIFFASGVWPGDLGEFQVVSERKKYGFAALVKLLEASQDRVSSVVCSHHGYDQNTCGGCPWLMIEYPAQLRMKESLVATQLKRAQLLEKVIPNPIWPSSAPLGYRNRAQFKTDGKFLGFVASGSHKLIDIQDCVILTDTNRQTLRGLRELLPRQNWKPHPPQSWTYLEVDESVSSADQIRPNLKLPFRQGNEEQNQRMKKWLKSRLQEFSTQTMVIELFAGSGNFTQEIASMGFSVLAVESSSQAIEALKSLDLPNTKTVTLNLFESKNWRHIKQYASLAEILILDPPREGFADLSSFVELCPNLRDIIYISCDLSSFTRDAQKLSKLGWKLQEVQPVDQFPQTPHIELLSYFKLS